MNLGRISTIQCVNVPQPPGDLCDDPAYALANPELCPPNPDFIIKPGVSLICELASVSFRAFTVINGAEADVTSQTVFQSSNGDVALIGATTGEATGTGAGSATITATYQGNTAQAELTVMSGVDCCENETVAIMVLVDQTRSMTQRFSNAYTTKLVYGKAVAAALIESVNESKDLVGLARFTKLQTTTLSPPISDKAAVAALVPQILQTQDDTTFFEALTSAIASLNDTVADRRMLVLISDGEDTTPSYVESTEPGPLSNPIQATDNFKAAGGVVVCLGVRAHGVGYNLLAALSTGGFFINAFPATEDAALDYVVALKGYLCAGNCTATGDVLEYQGALAYANLANWDIPGGGSVDLLGNGFFDYLPGNGLYLDLVGSGTPANPILITKDSFAVAAGEEYRVKVNLAGNHVFVDPLAMVQIRVRAIDSADLWLQNILIDDYLSGFHDYLFTFTPTVEGAVKIEIEQIGSLGFPTPDADQMSGILVNSVVLSSATNGTILFSDNFDTENPVYVPPACGQGTIPQEIGTDTSNLTLSQAGTADVNGDYTKVSETEWDQVGGAGYRLIYNPGDGFWQVQDEFATVLYVCTPENFPVGPWLIVTGDPYVPVGEYATVFGYAYGYNCYGDGCLDVPPVAQLEDPNPLPILESGPTPPQTFTSTKTACAECPPGFINMGVVLSGTTLTDGAAYETIVLLDAAASASFYTVTFLRNWVSDGPNPYLTLMLEGSYDGVTWDVLDSRDQIYGLSGVTLTYQLTPASAAYAYYRASVGTGASVGSAKVLSLSVRGAPENPVCREATAQGASQAAADQAATLAAQALANAALNCIAHYTATATYVASCPFGFDGTSTASAIGESLNSSDEAQFVAENAARDVAQYTLTCIPSIPVLIGGEDGEAIGGEDGGAFPGDMP